MTLTKNQKTLAIVLVLAVVAYFVFFNKPKTSSYHLPFEGKDKNTDAGL